MAIDKYSEFYSKAFFIMLLAGVLILSFLIIRPFVSAILSGAVIAYISYPIYKRVLKVVKSKNLSAFLVCLFMLIVISGPLLTILISLASQAVQTYNSVSSRGLGLETFAGACRDESNFLCEAYSYLNSITPGHEIQKYSRAVIEKVIVFIGNIISDAIVSLPNLILGIFIALFSSYYFLKDGKEIFRKIEDIAPLDKKHKRHIIGRFNQVTYAVFFGNIAIAIIQGVLGGIGFYIFGVQSPLLWAVVMIFAALLPIVGASVVWVPASLNLIILGYLDSSNTLMFKGIALMLYGALIISTADNILKPKIIGHKAKVHPLLVLLGILGGLNFFGISGIILGPAVLSLLLVILDIFREKSRGQG